MRAHGSQWISNKKHSAPKTIEKMKILGVVLELPAKQHCQSSPFTSKLGQIGQISSAGSYQTASRILGADSFYVKTIETNASAFFKVIIFSIGSVTRNTSKIRYVYKYFV